MYIRLGALFLFVAMAALAQTNNAGSANHPVEVANSSSEQFQNQTNQNLTTAQTVSQARADCIQSRRVICGKILKVLPDGLIVDSGYTNLMRSPVNRSWLVPGTVLAQRATNLVEGSQPDSICLGLVFLTDLPKKPAARVYDYVVLTGYPAGQYTYASIGDLRRTVRKFSAKLLKSVQWKLGEKQNAPLK
jgi:hypothetical protein